MTNTQILPQWNLWKYVAAEDRKLYIDVNDPSVRQLIKETSLLYPSSQENIIYNYNKKPKKPVFQWLKNFLLGVNARRKLVIKCIQKYFLIG